MSKVAQRGVAANVGQVVNLGRIGNRQGRVTESCRGRFPFVAQAFLPVLVLIWFCRASWQPWLATCRRLKIGLLIGRCYLLLLLFPFVMPQHPIHILNR